MRRIDYLLHGDGSSGGAHLARRASLETQRARVLKHKRSVAIDRIGEPLHIADGVKLELNVESDGTMRLIWRIDLVDELDRESGLRCRGMFLLDRRALSL